MVPLVAQKKLTLSRVPDISRKSTPNKYSPSKAIDSQGKDSSGCTDRYLHDFTGLYNRKRKEENSKCHWESCETSPSGNN